MRLMIALVVAMAIPVTGFAQWLNYPTAGVPRLADGKLNLAAPAPRTADGKPDLSGIWYLRALPCGPEGCLDYQPGAEFLNFGASLQGGLPYQPWAAQLVKERSAQFAKDERDVTFRQIFTDGRPLPADPEPSWSTTPRRTCARGR